MQTLIHDTATSNPWASLHHPVLHRLRPRLLSHQPLRGRLRRRRTQLRALGYHHLLLTRQDRRKQHQASKPRSHPHTSRGRRRKQGRVLDLPPPPPLRQLLECLAVHFLATPSAHRSPQASVLRSLIPTVMLHRITRLLNLPLPQPLQRPNPRRVTHSRRRQEHGSMHLLPSDHRQTFQRASTILHFPGDCLETVTPLPTRSTPRTTFSVHRSSSSIALVTRILATRKLRVRSMSTELVIAAC